MILTAFFDDRIETLTLPKKPAGRYLLGNFRSTPGPAAFVDGRGDDWLLTAAEGFFLSLPQAGGEEAAPPEGIVLTCPGTYLLHGKAGRTILLLAESILPEQGLYKKVSLPKKGSFTVGRGPRCDICFSGPALSARHALLIRDGNRTLIRDEDSTNGIYINGKRVFAQMLMPGDLIFIAGLKLVFCGSHLAVSPTDGRLSFSHRLTPFCPKLSPGARPVERSPAAPLQRPPRFLRRVETLSLKIDPPPSAPSGDELPPALVLGSALSMGMMSVVMLVSALNTGNTVSILMGAAMLLSSLVMPLITKAYEKRQRKKREALRRSRYRAYLSGLEETFTAACGLQEDILRENAPSPTECAARVLQTSPGLWERSLRRGEPILLRAGLGQALLDAALSAPERHFSLEDDPLQDELFQLLEKPRLLKNVPVTWTGTEAPVFGACGEEAAVRNFVCSLILQLASLYDSRELKLVFLDSAGRSPDYSFVRLLPHVWNGERDFRFYAADEEGARELPAWFEPLIEARLQMSDEALAQAEPRFVFFFPDAASAVRSAIGKRLLGLRRDLGFTLLFFGNELSELPRECRIAAELTQDGGRLFSGEDPTASGRDFTPDPVPAGRLRLLAKRLANIESSAHRQPSFPVLLPFLQLFDAGRIEHLNCADRWRECDPSRSLAAPVGISQSGDPLVLDLHERFHGPHALVAGMTGSGKSEWLSAYILSMAVRYSPREVSFVLIDYKGGGMAGAFLQLPHTAGIMTNLSGSGIARTLISLESELLRRQRLLSDACRIAGVGSMDIYDYQRRIRGGLPLEPLSHLFVICDEFAELKMHHPEFMEQLISTARIGRSLGVHLILATQKPGGVVDDQIRSNSRAKICLKVQDRADSIEMLNRPEAAALTAAGRFYLQVGFDELFELGQAAWAGAPYLPADHPEKEAPSIRVVDQNGRVLRSASLRPAASLYGAKRQQDAVIDYLKQTALAEDLFARPLWEEPLGDSRLLQDLLRQYGNSCPAGELAPVLGEYDDPTRQKKGLLRLSLSEKGHTLLFGAPGSGKTGALQVLLFSLLSEHSPEELHAYLMDFEAGELAVFSSAPHTGGVLTAADEPARAEVLIKLLEDEISARRSVYSENGAGQDPVLPRILLVIHNYPAFADCFPEAEERLCRLAGECSRYGIHLLATASATGSMRYRSLLNFSKQLTLQQSDAAEYPLILGPTGGLTPEERKGRGLIRLDAPVEFQTACLCDSKDTVLFLSKECLRLREEWRGSCAPRLPAIPGRITADLLRSLLCKNDPLRLPLGYDTAALVPYFFDFSAHNLTPVLSETSCLPFFRLLEALLSAAPHLTLFSEQDVISAADTVMAPSSEKAAPSSALPLLLIPDLPDLINRISEETADCLQSILETAARTRSCTVIFGGNPQDLSSLTYEKWYRTGVSSRNGIWLGPGFSGQYLLKAGSSQAYDGCSPQYAVCLKSGKAALVRLPEGISE